MALRNIVTEKEARLRKVSRPVEKFDERLWTLLDDMADTMYEADGVGIAGVQVGVLRRVFVVDIGEGLTEFINPTITAQSGEQDGLEGCLSSPGEYGLVVRPEKVTIEAVTTRNGAKLCRKRSLCRILIISLVSILNTSLNTWRRPHLPTRIGPRRHWKNAQILRSM